MILAHRRLNNKKSYLLTLFFLKEKGNETIVGPLYFLNIHVLVFDQTWILNIS